MKRYWLYVLGAPCLAALLSTVPLPGQAAKPKKEPPAQPAAESATPKTRSLGTVGAWSAYAAGDKASRICYLVGRPQKIDSAGVGRQPPVAMVTHRPSENIANVVSFIEGYPLKDGSDAALEVDDKKFDLFTNDDSAWARTAELDRSIVSAFIKGRTATVKGTPDKGKPTTDTYSLAGFSKALALIDEACGINRPETAAAQAAPALQAAPAPQTVAAPVKAAAPRKASTRKTSHKKVSKKALKKKKSEQTKR
ncbi:MAG TPA: invasion associated locus B family protein [Stellaceae bacterium]|nr:invasion associated locus B family protein [Stellaceae bacterium]